MRWKGDSGKPAPGILEQQIEFDYNSRSCFTLSKNKGSFVKVSSFLIFLFSDMHRGEFDLELTIEERDRKEVHLECLELLFSSNLFLSAIISLINSSAAIGNVIGLADMFFRLLNIFLVSKNSSFKSISSLMTSCKDEAMAQK